MNHAAYWNTPTLHDLSATAEIETVDIQLQGDFAYLARPIRYGGD